MLKQYVHSDRETYTTIQYNRIFHKLDKIGNNANTGIRDFTMGKQKIPVTICYHQ